MSFEVKWRRFDAFDVIYVIDVGPRSSKIVILTKVYLNWIHLTLTLPIIYLESYIGFAHLLYRCGIVLLLVEADGTTTVLPRTSRSSWIDLIDWICKNLCQYFYLAYSEYYETSGRRFTNIVLGLRSRYLRISNRVGVA